MSLKNIEHVVVVMMENRSFDNLLGWLYETGSPALVIPRSDLEPYAGLKKDTYWNALDASPGQKVFASYPPKPWPPVCPTANQVPTPDPHEELDYVTKQLYGDTPPNSRQAAPMSGFLQNYSTTAAGVSCAGQIMETYGPEDAYVINALAKNFAVCDRWFSSMPTQTWPNRGFVHTGSSDGHLNNENYEPHANRTIFNVLADHGISWNVFHDTTYVPSLTHVQFRKLWDLDDNFFKFSEFKKCCAARPDGKSADKLPAYSFVEPRFLPEPGRWFEFFRTQYPNDFHPPHDVHRGNEFLSQVYEAVRTSPYRDKILLVITFDEHGGCYDHVPPPWGAQPPEPSPETNGFKYDRFGVRVPAIVISSYVTPGTVFRASANESPYDHTSILATLRDWLNLDADPDQHLFLPSPRIADAPTLDRVLTRATPSTNWPPITTKWRLLSHDATQETPLNDVQKSLVAHMTRIDSNSPGTADMESIADATRRNTSSYKHAMESIKDYQKK